MRLLIVPEYYRPDDLSANGTVNDAVAWMRYWLDRDPTPHVYVLAPSDELSDTDAVTLLGDRDRVTLIEAAPAMAELESREPFTDTGYSAAQLRALRRRIHDDYTYSTSSSTSSGSVARHFTSGCSTFPTSGQPRSGHST